jgi:signal recognition particle subunit SRP54
MTPDERHRHGIINGSRRKRIAKGSGTSVEEVNRLLKQFTEMQKVLKMVGQGNLPGMKGMKGMKGMPKLPQMPGGGAGGGGFAPPGVRKKKKKGPWGLIKSR